MDNSAVSATVFHTIFFPENQTVSFNINGESQVSSNVTLEFLVIGYGYTVYSFGLNPCLYAGLGGLCPMRASSLPDLHSNYRLPHMAVRKIPGV